MQGEWEQIGRILQEARENAGLAVDDVVFQTRIPKSAVQALEAEDFSVFASPTYARSFLRQYSGFLNVDAEEWIEALEPAAYVGGESWQPMFSEAQGYFPVKREVKDPRWNEREHPPAMQGRWSTVWLMALTGGIVFGLTMAYRFIEKKFGDPESHELVEKAEEKAPVEEFGEPMPVETVSLPKSDPDPVPPRAVIVRE